MKLIEAYPGWKVVYNVNKEYFIEDILFYASIRDGSYWEFIPITPQELHLPRSLKEYLLKDGYIGLITPENELVVDEYRVEDIKHIDVSAIKKALKRNRFDLD